MKKLVQAIVGVVLSVVASQKVTAEEPTWNYAVQVSAAVQESPARITLSWPQDTSGTPGSYTVYRKSAGSTSWGGGTSLSGSTTTYTDTSVAANTPAVVAGAGADLPRLILDTVRLDPGGAGFTNGRIGSAAGGPGGPLHHRAEDWLWWHG